MAETVRAVATQKQALSLRAVPPVKTRRHKSSWSSTTVRPAGVLPSDVAANMACTIPGKKSTFPSAFSADGSSGKTRTENTNNGREDPITGKRKTSVIISFTAIEMNEPTGCRQGAMSYEEIMKTISSNSNLTPYYLLPLPYDLFRDI